MRHKSVTYTAFNVTLHPHSPQKYIDLFDACFDLRRSINLRGDSYGLMTSLNPIDRDDEAKGLIGEIGRYTRIHSERWLNTLTLKPAEKNERKSIHIPEELKPNYLSYGFVFYPMGHKLIVECKDSHGAISPKTLYRYFRSLFDTPDINDRFGRIELTAIPDADQLDKIFKIERLRILTLTINRPNPDDFDDLEEDVLERLNNQNVREQIITFKAQQGATIVPDAFTKGMSKVAEHNGKVEGEGSDREGKKVSLSTDSHPLQVTGTFPANTITQMDFLVSMAQKIRSKLRSAKANV